MIDASFTYAFVDNNDTRQVIHGHEIVNRNGWQGATTYYRYDGVTSGNDDYLALGTNSNVPPDSDPTLWSILVNVDDEGDTTAQTGVDLYARSVGTQAMAVAADAYTLAQNGTNLVIIEQGSRVAADIDFQTQISAIIVATGSDFDANLIEEQGSRAAADQNLLNLINSEAATRTANDSNVIALVTTELNARTAADEALLGIINSGTAQLAAETAARIANDQTIITIAAAGTTAGNSALALVQTEAGTRSSADQFLLNLIATVSGSSSGTFADISSQLTSEIAARQANDTSILGIAVTGTNAALKTGGTTGQVLKKASNTSYDTAWADMLPTATLAASGTITVDFSVAQFQTIPAPSGSTTILTTNRANGRFASVRIVNSGNSRALLFPESWSWLANDNSLGVTQAANKVAVLSLTCYGTLTTDIIAVYSAQP